MNLQPTGAGVLVIVILIVIVLLGAFYGFRRRR
jgi:LPXTG-motif cell wall-anchored protein